jgi:hypothetical protein
MAIYHLNASVGSRQRGQSARAKSDYLTRSGKYARDRDDLSVVESGNMPAWAAEDPARYWQTIDDRERANGTLYRQVEVALPVELEPEQRAELARIWAAELAQGKGGRLPYTLAVHEQDGNPHAHLMLSERLNDGRDLAPETWCKRAPQGARKVDLGRHAARQAWLASARERWAQLANEHLAKAGHEARIDHRTLEAQGIDRVPGVHLGPAALAMEARGIPTERGSAALARDEINRELAQEAAAYEQAHSHGRTQNGSQSRHDRRTGRALGPGHGDTRGRSAERDGHGQNRDAGRDIGHVPEPRPDSAGRDPSRAAAEQGGVGGAGRGRGRAHREQGGDLETLGGPGGRRDPAHDSAADRIVDLAAPRNSSGQRGDDMATAPVDRTAQAVKRQLKAMDCERYEIGICDQARGMMNREWTGPEIMSNLAWLKRQNAQGADIYIRPHADEAHDLVLVDDVDGVTLEEMAAEGLEPALVVETSPKNIQAWVRVENASTGQIRAEVARLCVDRYDADPGSVGHHYGRLAGFTNRKPEHEAEGRSPYCLCRGSSGQTASASAEIVAEAEERLQARQRAQERHRREKAIKVAPRQAYGATARYRAIYGSLMRKYGDNLDPSRADYAVAKSMAMDGYGKDEIGKAMAEASPGLAERHDVEDYVTRTLAAVEQLPEVQQARQEQEQKRGPKMGL